MNEERNAMTTDRADTNAPYTTELSVRGMTCEHCVAAVRGELGRLSGVSDVSVDLTAGRVRVASTAPLDDAEVAAAVDEAGYELVGR